jgi:hypothetical protein
VAALRTLVPGPALRVLPELYCEYGIAVSDVCPADVRFFGWSRTYTAALWAFKMQRRHWAERARLAPVLPCAAMLYV